VRRLTVYVSLLVMLDLALFSAIVPLLPQFAERLDLSKFESGILLGAYSAAVVVAAVPVGHLADRIGMRTVTIAGSLLMAAATVAFALGDSYSVLVGARLAQGLASAAAWSAALGWLAGGVPSTGAAPRSDTRNAAATGGMVPARSWVARWRGARRARDVPDGGRGPPAAGCVGHLRAHPRAVSPRSEHATAVRAALSDR
jgi:MFS family permease